MNKSEKIEVAHFMAEYLVENADFMSVADIAAELDFEPTQEELEDIYSLVINAQVTVK